MRIKTNLVEKVARSKTKSRHAGLFEELIQQHRIHGLVVHGVCFALVVTFFLGIWINQNFNRGLR